jgi:hypothetical protein
MRGRRHRMNKTTAAWLGAGTATLMLPAAAEAAGTKPEAYLSPGVVWSSASGPGRAASGFGFEISGGLLLTRKQEPTGDPNNMYPAPDTDDLVKLLLTTPSVGAVFRTEGYTSAEATFRRYTYALQGGFGPLGVELGWGHRTSYLTEPARGGFHLSPFVTIGWLYAGPQWLFDGGTPREFAFQVGLKLPLPYSIAIPLGLIGGSGSGGGPGGRPIRRDHTPRVAQVRKATRRRTPSARSPSLANVSEQERARAATSWLANARAEHASIAAFSKVSLQLQALGAPSRLLRAVHRAALDEIRRADLCFALASWLADEPVTAGTFVDLSGLQVDADPIVVAVETLWDGCLGEGIAAEDARVSAGLASVQRVQRALRTIARDEARHAETAWQMLSFLAVGDGVRDALAACLATLEEPRWSTSAPVVDPGAPALGLLPGATREAIARSVRARVAARLRALLEVPASSSTRASRESDDTASNARRAQVSVG